jgi:hypothetical protein
MFVVVTCVREGGKWKREQEQEKKRHRRDD